MNYFGLIKQAFIIVAFLLTAFPVNGQIDACHTEPPHLRSGKHLGDALMLGYRGEVNSFEVITIRFKLKATGILDTLHISDNAPPSFVEKATRQLTDLNGQWIPQKVNGKSVESKWLLSRYYIAGYRESDSLCIKEIQQKFFDSYKREEELFLCNEKRPQPLECFIEYIEGYDFYLSLPLLSETVR